MRFKPPKFLYHLLPELVWDISDRGPVPCGDAATLQGYGPVPDGGDLAAEEVSSGDVYLTFDDGPTPGVTEWILDELERWDARATFFCLGRNVEAHPELYERIVAAGHRVGNHTHNHLKGWQTSLEDYVDDVDRAARVIGGSLFRPPYGRITPVQARALAPRYRIVMWNIISRDYNRRLSPRTCLDNVIKHVRPGDIVVFHDSKKAWRNMRHALRGTLRHLHANGMRSKAIDL